MGDAEDVPRGPRWWPQQGEKPDPRWTLANERTLLAYNRTALALLVAGVAVVGSRWAAGVPAWLAALGLPLIGLSGAVALAARARFLRVEHALWTERPLPAPAMAVALSVGIAVVAGLALAVAVTQLR